MTDPVSDAMIEAGVRAYMNNLACSSRVAIVTAVLKAAMKAKEQSPSTECEGIWRACDDDHCQKYRLCVEQELKRMYGPYQLRSREAMEAKEEAASPAKPLETSFFDQTAGSGLETFAPNSA